MTGQTLRNTREPVRLLAALPPLLFGLALALHVIVFVPLSTIVWGAATPIRLLPRTTTAMPPLVLFAGLILVLAGGAVVGLLRRVASWSHTWTTTTVVAVALALMILGDDAPYLISPIGDMLVMLALLLPLALIALLAARQSMTEAALVALGFVNAFSLAVVFSSVASPMLRMDLALGAAPAGAAFALLIAAYLRSDGAARWIALALTVVLSGALIWTYGAAVASVLSGSIAWRFLRVLGPIAVLGFLAPLALAFVLSFPHRRALRSA